MSKSQNTITRLIEGLGSGRRDAVDDLFRIVYDELHELAHAQRQRWRGDHTLNTTALVHEVYVKLVGQEVTRTEDRAHFRALASRAMRHVLCNYSRGRETLKRGGRRAGLPAEQAAEVPAGGAEPDSDAASTDALLALDEALTTPGRTRPRAAQVVECRFFGGMSVEETAVAVGASPRSVKRDWALAQAWLHRELEDRLRDGHLTEDD